jgi:hypothetical protein
MVALSTLTTKAAFLAPGVAPGLLVKCDGATLPSRTGGTAVVLVVNEGKVIEMDETSQVEPSDHRVYAPVM